MVVDIIIGVVLLVSAVISFLRGLIREVLTIIGVVSGFLAAYFMGGYFVPTLNDWMGIEEGAEPTYFLGIVPYETLSQGLSYSSIFILVVVFVSLISHVLAESAKDVGLGALDRTLGVVFGLARGVLLLGFAYLLPHVLLDDETKASWFEGSRAFPYLETTTIMIAQVMPEGFSQIIEDNNPAEAIEGLDTSEARKQLEALDILPTSEDVDEGQNKINTEDADPKAGYTEEFRKEMDSLFQQEGAVPAE